MSLCWTSDDDIEVKEYQQQTVVDTRIETGQPSLPSLPLLRPLNTANKTSDTCRETPSADLGNMAMTDQISSAILKAQDIQFSNLSDAICDGLKQFSSNFVDTFNAKFRDEPPQKRARIDVHPDGSSIGRETPRQGSSSSCTIAKSVVVPVISLDNQNDYEKSGNPDNTDAVSVHAGDDFDELWSEDNKEDESDDEEANAAVEKQLKKVEREFTQNEKTSDSMSPKLAAAVNKMWVSQAEEDKIKGRLNKYLRPENCTGLSVPKANPEIWLTIKPCIRSTDVKLQRLQNLMIKAALPVIKVANKLMASKKIKKEEAKETECTLDSLAILSQANQETLGRRREQIKPGLNKQFRQLCRNVSPESTLLVSDDINKRISDIAATNRTVDKFKPSKSTHYYVHGNSSKSFKNFPAKGPCRKVQLQKGQQLQQPGEQQPQLDITTLDHVSSDPISVDVEV